MLIHCGDLCSPFIIKQLSTGFRGIPIHIVWGNNDGDRRMLTELAMATGHIQIHGDFAEIEVDEHKVAVTHYPEIAIAIAHSDHYDLVCYGHDHSAHEEMVDDTLLINPGEVMGLNGRCTVAIVSLPDGMVEWIEF